MLVLGAATLVLFLDQWNILWYDIGAISGSFQCWFLCNNHGQSRFCPSSSIAMATIFTFTPILSVEFRGCSIEETFYLWRVAKRPWRCRTINVSSWVILCSCVATFTLNLGVFNELKETARTSQLKTTNSPRNKQERIKKNLMSVAHLNFNFVLWHCIKLNFFQSRPLVT